MKNCIMLSCAKEQSASKFQYKHIIEICTKNDLESVNLNEF